MVLYATSKSCRDCLPWMMQQFEFTVFVLGITPPKDYNESAKAPRMMPGTLGKVVKSVPYKGS